jgi:nicotinate-nucleotide pyrophosphorylase (carboxylating)
VLIKDNHIVAARLGGLDDLEAVVTHARNQAPHTLRIEIEVTSVEQLREALEGRPDIILLDNMRPDEIRECVEITAGRALLEASGGVSLQAVRAIAETGVDYVSVGRITHSAPAMDISLEIGAV